MTVNEIITQQIIDRIEEAKRTGKTFHWVKPFGENACRFWIISATLYTD